jgi:Family of unknown function (DUF5681)
MEGSATGYRRPPSLRQFKKGQSGNPKGRPKGAHNLKTDLAAIMEKRLPIRENGEQRLVSGRELMLLKLFEKAVTGDTKAITQIVGMLMKLDTSDAPLSQPRIVSENDRTIVGEFLRRKSVSNKTEVP